MLQWLRSKFHKEPNHKDKIYKHKFAVQVNIDHPRIIPHVVTAQIIIDAHTRQHAIKQVQEEMKITIGRIYLMKPKRVKD